MKYHRTVTTYVNTLLDCGFRLAKLCEPHPMPTLLETHPEWQEELRRPMFLLLAAIKPDREQNEVANISTRAAQG